VEEFMENTMTRSIALSVNLVDSAANCKGPLQALDRATLQLLEQRYKQFLTLAHQHPQQTLVPTGDIDEMWHLHMLHPRAYFNDCMALFGGIVDHHPDFANADGAMRTQLADCFSVTAALWEQLYGAPYMLTRLGDAAIAADGAGGQATPALAGAYCIMETAAAHAPQVGLGAAYCVESAAVKAGAQAAILGAAYCI
jgi:hypothetical protein